MVDGMTTPAIPTEEPFELSAGDTWTWLKSLADYPASDWTLSYRLLTDSASPTAINFSASASGDDHLVSVAPATTAAYAAGTYQYRAYATHTDGRRFTVGSGYFKVLPNFAVSTADPRSQVKRTLDAINSLLEGKAGADKQAFKIGGIEITKMTPEQLMKWRSAYQQLYREELAANAGYDDTERQLVEFVNP